MVKKIFYSSRVITQNWKITGFSGVNSTSLEGIWAANKNCVGVRRKFPTYSQSFRIFWISGFGMFPCQLRLVGNNFLLWLCFFWKFSLNDSRGVAIISKQLSPQDFPRNGISFFTSARFHLRDICKVRNYVTRRVAVRAWEINFESTTDIKMIFKLNKPAFMSFITSNYHVCTTKWQRWIWNNSID